MQKEKRQFFHQKRIVAVGYPVKLANFASVAPAKGGGEINYAQLMCELPSPFVDILKVHILSPCPRLSGS